ncbi:MAG TPA: YceI family protein [Salinimicrobium sp.]|nr:YceI family protein [Salinimicrobium sp.]
MKKVLSFVLLSFVATITYAQSTWNVDKAHSQVSFGITHMGISEIEGLFRDFDATIVASEEDFSDAVFNVSIDISSVDTGIEMRDNHLRTSDFFDVEKYPTMTFKSSKIEKVAENKYKITGDLSFHGVTKPVTLDVWYRGSVKNEKGIVSGFQITGSINRKDFNIANETPEVALSNEVKIKVDAEFKK